jgi:hydrogenase 3 maturation protease
MVVYLFFESQLSSFLQDFEKLIILGVGNELECDDGVGPYIIKKLKDENIEDNA